MRSTASATLSRRASRRKSSRREHGTAYRIKCMTWLAPFDLGVSQRVAIETPPTETPDVYEIRLLIDRESGDISNWKRVNRRFLNTLRKQFLIWRTLKQSDRDRYLQENETMRCKGIVSVHRAYKMPGWRGLRPTVLRTGANYQVCALNRKPCFVLEKRGLQQQVFVGKQPNASPTGGLHAGNHAARWLWRLFTRTIYKDDRMINRVVRSDKENTAWRNLLLYTISFGVLIKDNH